MPTNVKAALKAAKTALDANNFSEAASQARTVLEQDPENYFAHIFLGRALEKDGDLEKAAVSYKRATAIKPDDELAWRGLTSLYHAQGSSAVDLHTVSSLSLAQIYAEKDDAHQCQTIIDKSVSFAKEHGTRAEYRAALESILPTSPVYTVLEGRVPNPGHTYMRIAEIAEAEEKERINREIGERRTRLGARLGQVKADVTRDVYDQSDLEKYFENVIDWTNDDDIRRNYEEKLLQHSYDHLCVLASDAKEGKRNQVLKLARDMVIIKHPFKLAWFLELEWSDFDQLVEFDRNILLEYIDFFPTDGLALALMSHLGLGVKKDETSDEQGEADNGAKTDSRARISDEERLLLLEEGLEKAKSSPLARRIASAYYQELREYDSCIEVSKIALELYRGEGRKSGLLFQSSIDDAGLNMATALVFYQSPKNHPEAKSIFDEVLQRKPNATAALLGIGLIYEERDEYDQATSFLDRALERDPNNERVRVESAWCRALTGDLETGLSELKTCHDNIKTVSAQAKELKALVSYRIGKCLWDLHPDKASRRSRQGPYIYFLNAIKTNPNLAAAYTSLGTYYADYAKDRKRSRQCFQKAFELSGTEIEAAERLARDFASDGEWDIVELIAQRAVESGVVRPPPGSKRKGHSWPMAALGVVAMNRQDFPEGVTFFQAALRIRSDDYHSWVGLGESYHSSGRYNAARRTLEHALSICANNEQLMADSWFARYMLANVHRELYEYAEAVSMYKEVLTIRPDEFGVSIALLQTLVEQAWNSLQTGFYGAAAKSASSAITHGYRMLEHGQRAFNFWKAIGDACSVFAWIPKLLSDLPVDALRDILGSEIAKQENVLDNLDKSTHDSVLQTDESQQNLQQWCLRSALVAYKTAIVVVAGDIHAHAVAWYNLGWGEFLAYTASSKTQSTSDRKERHRYVQASVRCFKRAIELEASNSEFWNALGIVTIQLSPRVSQHSFIRSLNLNERSARTWTNLGALYLLQNEFELAHEAFSRAQSTDPDYAYAWLGEGLIALLTGDNHEGIIHLTHAAEIADGAAAAVKSNYVISVFDSLLSSKPSYDDVTRTAQSLLALQQLQTQMPKQLQFRHLLALMMERVGDYDGAVERLTEIAAFAEEQYEKAESPTSLALYVKVKQDLARNLLAKGDFADAAESAETALDLTSEQDDGVLQVDERSKIRLSAHLSAGLSRYRLGSVDEALETFRNALDESKNSPQVIAMLSKVLWAKGDEAAKESARDHLFESVGSIPGDAEIALLLGAIAAADGDQDTEEAVVTDLRSLMTSDDQDTTSIMRIELLLGKLAELKDDQNGHAAQFLAALSPEQPQGWKAIASSSGDTYAGEMSLSAAKRSTPPRGTIEAKGLAEAYAGVGSLAGAQAAIMLCPWESIGHQALSEALIGAA